MWRVIVEAENTDFRLMKLSFCSVPFFKSEKQWKDFYFKCEKLFRFASFMYVGTFFDKIDRRLKRNTVSGAKVFMQLEISSFMKMEFNIFA